MNIVEQNIIEEEFRNLYHRIYDKKRMAIQLRNQMIDISEDNGIPFVDLDGTIYKPVMYKNAQSKFSSLDQDIVADILGCSVYSIKYDDNNTYSDGWTHSQVCW
jgi:hypothetical protein